MFCSSKQVGIIWFQVNYFLTILYIDTFCSTNDPRALICSFKPPIMKITGHFGFKHQLLEGTCYGMVMFVHLSDCTSVPLFKQYLLWEYDPRKNSPGKGHLHGTFLVSHIFSTLYLHGVTHIHHFHVCL